MKASWQLASLPSSSLGWIIFGTIYLPIFTLSSSEYTLYFAWHQGEIALERCRAMVCFSQSTHHTLTSDTNFLPRKGDRGIPDITFTGEYTGISLEVLVQCIITIYPVLGYPAGWGKEFQYWWNLILQFFPRPSNCQIFPLYMVIVFIMTSSQNFTLLSFTHLCTLLALLALLQHIHILDYRHRWQYPHTFHLQNM